jgi:hypothetical protein
MYAINGSGQVVGCGQTDPINNDFPQAFIGTTSGGTPIPLPSGWSGTYGLAINASGEVVGYGSGTVAFPNGQAFVGTTSGSEAIPLPRHWANTAGPVASAINNSGHVAGYGTNGSIDQAFIGTTAGSSVIPLPSGWTNFRMCPRTVNPVLLRRSLARHPAAR